MSQQSDIYSSSLYEGDLSTLAPIPTLAETLSASYFDSDGLTPFTPEPQFGHQSFTSVPESDFAQPQSIPPTLTRVRPDRLSEYILYSDMDKEVFLNWWFQTTHGKRREAKTFNWDRTGHLSEVWKHFDQVAVAGDGLPKVRCQRCGKILDHPGHTKAGTNSMGRHWKGEKCRRAAKHAQQPTIQRLLQDEASRPSKSIRTVSKEEWVAELITTVAILRLPFQVVEHPQFQKFIRMSRLVEFSPEFPSPRTISRRLRSIAKERQQAVLRGLPVGAKLSLAIDCWTSPFQQAFMAVTGYFVDDEWSYREVLLGFEPLHGTHSGVNLSAMLMELLQQHQIVDRVLAITTDNASNNNTLMSNINESVESLNLDDSTTILRVPCIAHVIQLSLKQLLGQMEANPKNETTEIWSEARSKSVRTHARQNKREIVDTLNKVRNVAIYINASPQRREAFCNLQTGTPKLVPIQDVKTRWNSTFLMLRRAKRLQATFNEFCSEYRLGDLTLSQDEWRQIEYLLWTTQPFFKFTTILCKSKDTSIHIVFEVYNNLFEHLEKSIRQLQRKRVHWKQGMLKALSAARDKLADYYGKTDDIHGDLFAIGTILAPEHKMQFFASDDWEESHRKQYRESLGACFTSYKQRLANPQAPSQAPSSSKPTEVDEIQVMLKRGKHRQRFNQRDEISQYLETDPIDISPRMFWKENQLKYPALAAAARDVLSIPATGAGVERLFNSARDVCHYRRGSLNATTIQDLMLFMCASKFDVDEKELALISEFLSDEEKEEANEEKSSRFLDDLDPISDSEEDNVVVLQEHLAVQGLSERAAGKRRRSVASDADGEAQEITQSDDNADIPLPDVRRVSGRNRKRTRREDDDFVHY